MLRDKKIAQMHKDQFALDKAFAMCFSSPDGAKVLEYFEAAYFANSTPYKGEDTEFRCGQQSVVFDVKRKIQNGNT